MDSGLLVGFAFMAMFVVITYDCPASALSSALGALLFWGYFRTPRGEFAQRVDVGV